MIQKEAVILIDFQMKHFDADDYNKLQCWGGYY